MRDTYNLIVVGTGIASSVFLHGWLRRAAPSARVLVLERGARQSHAQRLADPRGLEHAANASFANHTAKPWRFALGFGGSSNCWYACTPRLLPNDFRMRSTYGVGEDWPVDYDQLESYYGEAEQILAVAGPSEHSPFERSRSYPQPPHRLSTPDRHLARAFPEHFFVQPTARASQPIAGRPACCGNGVCSLCPVDAKFTVQNGLSSVYSDPRVTLRDNACVLALDLAGNVARGVWYRHKGREAVAAGERVVLGANALFNAFLLLRSGLEHPALGSNLHEQVSVRAVAKLDALDGLDGSTVITGHGYMFYDGEHRQERAAALVETINAPRFIRTDPGRWRQVLPLKFIFEELPRPDVRVELNAKDPERPRVVGDTRASAYVRRSREQVDTYLSTLLASLPIESVTVESAFEPTESHLLGTTRMGQDPRSSVADSWGVLHSVRNVAIVGGSLFPTSSPANPSLTIAALALRTAAEWSA